MGETNKYGVILYLDSEKDKPSLINEFLGLTATKLIYKGTPFTNSKGKLIPNKFHDSNIWVYEFEEIKSNDKYLNECIESALSQMDKYKLRFIEVFNKYSKYKLLCYSYLYDYNPYFLLTRSTISRLNEYNIDIEFDMYCLADD